MPADDGSKVRIHHQTVFRGPDGNWWQIVIVCNRTADFLTVEVTTHPYAAPGRKMMGQPLTQVIVIPPGVCLPLVFKLPGKPMQYYTDVYAWDEDALFKRGERYHYNVDTMPARLPDYSQPSYPDDPSRRQGSFRQSLPFPRSLEPEGRALRFVVRDIRGLPPGWRLEGLWPERGRPVLLAPDEREHPMVLAVSFPPKPLASGIHTIEIDVGIVGRKLAPPNIIPLRIPLVGLLKPPQIVSWKSVRNARRRTYVEFTAIIEQEHGLWDSPLIRYSKDAGRSWRDEIMAFDSLVPLRDDNGPSLRRAQFSFSLPTSGFRSEVLASLILRDSFGGEYHSAITRHPARRRGL